MQDALVADLADLFEGQTLSSSTGDKRPIRVYSQDLPIIEGMDETEDRTEEIPEPYIIVRTNEGNIPDANSAQEADLILVICVYATIQTARDTGTCCTSFRKFMGGMRKTRL